MKQKGSVLLPVIIITSFLGVIGFLFYQNTQLPSQNQAQSESPTPKLTTKTTNPDLTSEWIKFNNDTYTIKYPDSWDTAVIGDNSSSRMVAPKEIIDKVKQAKGGFGGGTFLTITINTNAEKPVWETSEYWTVTNEQINIDGVSATKYNISVIQDGPGFSSGDKITSVVVKYNGKYTKIELLDQKYKDIYNQILATFKLVK